MDEASRRAAGRQGGFLFAAAGLVTIATSQAASQSGGRPGVLVVTGLVAVLTGLVAWRAPWHRWRPQALLVLSLIALVLITVGNYAGDADPYTYGVYFFLLFAWVGVTQPRWTPLVIAPFAAAAYVIPLEFSRLHSGVGLTAAFVAIPSCVLVGETIARTVDALRRARHLDARRVGDLEAIVGAGALLQGDVEREDVGDLLARVATSILHGNGSLVLLVDSDAGLVTAGSHVLDGAALVDVLPPPSAVDSALSGGQPVVDDDRIVVPLRGSTGTLGVVAVSCPGHGSFDQFTLHVAHLFGAQAGLALEQVRAIEELTEAAMNDPLTGVGNRRRAAALLEHLHPGDAVVLIDLDHFKLVNDTAGHAAGDKVLVALGRYLREHARGADTVARYGGEEFLVVFRNAGQGASAATERLVDGWRQQRPLTTFSAGVAVHVPGRSPAATLGRADAALYRAKRTGRDRVCEDSDEKAVDTA